MDKLQWFLFAFGLAVLIYIVRDIFKRGKRERKGRLLCRHEFRLRDLKHRDEQGMVRWPCCKCGKEFIAENGLKILNKGKCIGD